LDAGIDAFSAISKYIFLLFCPFHSMRTFALVLACFAFTGHARRVQDMQGGDGIENGAAKLTAREWELQNLARRRMGKMSNGELGLANLMSAARDPSMLNELAQMPAANQNFVELQKMLADPDFRKQVENFAERMHLSKDAAASSFLKDAKRVYEQIKTYIGQDHLSTLEQSQSGLDSLVEVGEFSAQKRFTAASAFVPAAKSSLPRISRPRSTAVTQMSTDVADVDNVGITGPVSDHLGLEPSEEPQQSVASAGSPFFDTEGRLSRTTGPAGGEVNRFVPVHNGRVLVRESGSNTEPVLLTDEQAAPLLEERDCIQAWLGSAHDDGPLGAHGADGKPTAFWLIELSHLPEPPRLVEGARWAPLRAARGPGGGEGAVLDREVGLRSDDEVALLSVARGLALWHRSVKFCSACGGAMRPCRNGRNRECVDCATRFRPRVDPSVIVLVVDPSRSHCLLGRKASWPAGRYSTLAGFVEFGETLEECVVREVMEETGVACRRSSLASVASQPWLFPRSLMVGYIAVADVGKSEMDAPLDFDVSELDDARWFSKDMVRARIALQGDADEPPVPGDFHVPSRISLARTLIERWLAEDDLVAGGEHAD